jgi:hypothetical protein
LVSALADVDAIKGVGVIEQRTGEGELEGLAHVEIDPGTLATFGLAFKLVGRAGIEDCSRWALRSQNTRSERCLVVEAVVIFERELGRMDSEPDLIECDCCVWGVD